MKTNILICLLALLPFYAIGQCEDPTIQIISDCGTEFDLCLDEYSTGVDVGILLEIFINDDLGIFDPCETDTLSGTENGSLSQLENCNWFYQPDLGYVGNDTFYYILNYNDVCVTQCYCSSDPGCLDGRIWTIDALYLGEDNSNNGSYDPTVLVKDKDGTTFSTHEHLNWGDDFFADGSSLHQSTTNYEYQLFLEGDTTSTPDEIVLIHVSCSEEIFGETYGFVRPISGCIAPTSQKSTCAGVGDSFGDDKQIENVQKSVMGAELNVAEADTTIVVITINSIAIPIEILSFEGHSTLSGNELFWNVYNDQTNYIELQSSSDGDLFESIYKTKPSTENSQERYIDRETRNSQYYRLAVTDYNGNIFYSEILFLERKSSLNATFLFSPNPFEDKISINLQSDQHVKYLKMYDHFGKLIRQQNYDEKIDLIELNFNETLSPGIYVITLEGEDWVNSKKLVKL